MAAQSETSTIADPSDGDGLDVLEMATAVLMRNFELLRRRSTAYTELDKAEYLLLRTLDRVGPADIGTLASAVGLDPSTAGRQVAVLESKSLVHREPAAADRRRSIIAPTDEGRRRMETTRARRRENTAELLADWSAEDLRQLGNLLTRYNKAVADRYLTD
ncbi:MAG TPA: MarR family transcriptional regulator [Pseudonocardiaceae bacterium]|nr:MarR family transcriptional regulator [Pseudonocardiaceae bacterium]